MSTGDSGFARALAALSHADVEFIVVGVGGINLSGFDYAGLSEDASLFEVAGARVRVGRLDKLLRSKEASGRPKDRAFLRAFRATRGVE